MPLDLVAFLREADSSSFPNRGDYSARYGALAEYMNTNVHKDVVLGAIAKDGGLLNDHGPDHIRTVMARAGDMLSGDGAAAVALTPYEVYLLLCAIHFHDVGNVYGREGHEQRAQDVMRAARPLLNNDSTEIQCILKIAHAHGGHNNGDKDKIGQLQDDPVNGRDVRVRALAAVLRFADELADDRHRANRFLLEHELLPREAEVFHKYAASLHSVMVRPDERGVDLHFCVSTEDVQRKWGKKGAAGATEEVYIIDEIYSRTVKMHLERSYCARFMRSLVELNHVNVKVDIFDEPDSFHPPRRRIGYRLEERGYPGAPNEGIHSMCRDLRTGEELAAEFGERKL